VANDRYRSNQFQLRLTGWTNDIIDPDELVSYAITPETNQNYHTGWTNQQAIDLAHQGEAELDPNKRRDIYYQIQKIHQDDAPFVYLYVLPYIDVLSTKVKGFFHHPMGQYVFTNMSVQS
jgi:peptide/nickel transport system substrate-binding protein